MALLLVLQAALITWGAARNSVTFDENYHLAAGVAYVTRGYTAVSVAQPPLVKALCAAPALLAGARVPPDSVMLHPAEVRVAEAFMRANADRYHRIFFAARMSVLALSLLLAWLVWRFASTLYGPRGGLLALAAFVLMPETLAHGGVVGMDLPTGLGFFASVYAFWNFYRTGAWRWWAATAVAVAATALTRFSVAQLGPILIVLAAIVAVTGAPRRPARMWLGLALIPVVAFAVLQAGYLGQTTLEPLSTYNFRSALFRSLQAAHPAWRPPLPDPYVGGLDYLIYLAGTNKPSYLLGQVLHRHVWYYFPLAALFKWPIGWMGLLVTRAGTAALRPRTPGRGDRDEIFLLVPAAIVFGFAMASNLDYGIRYLYPVVPFLCVWMGGLVSVEGRVPKPLSSLTTILVVTLALETAITAPWYLSFFNLGAGGPGRGDRLMNDSNVDWGQGLIALRDEMRRRGIARIHLCYHGSTDPAMYGIDYLPFAGGKPGPESDWLAVSSYYLVGLDSPMMTSRGPTPFTIFDFHALWNRPPQARPAHCMYLYRLR